MGEILTLEALQEKRKGLSAAGRQVVFTNGYFDLLHLGHTRYLQQAKALGDILIVAVNVDATARQSKDSQRPIIPQDERAEVVAALACVDYVVLFEGETAVSLVSLLRPDIYVKGGDYGAEGDAPLPEAAAVEAYGGQVVILPYQAGHSTTDIIETIVRRYAPSTNVQ